MQVLPGRREEALVVDVLILAHAPRKALLEVGVHITAGDFAARRVELEVGSASCADFQQLQFSRRSGEVGQISE